MRLNELIEALHEPDRPYRSAGERQLAQLLDDLQISYRYEEPVLVRAGDYWRIWYPDFTLQTPGRPRVEYFGIDGDPDYAAARRYKQRVYAANQIPVLGLTPRDLADRTATADRLYRLAGQSPRSSRLRSGVR